MRWWRSLLLVVLLACGGAHAQTLESVLAPGVLIKGHAKVDHECDSCHVRFNPAGQDALCLKCHKDVAADVQEKRGWHGRQKLGTCRSCHTDHRGRDAKVAEFDTKKFDHRQTDWELRQRHAELDCAKCHAPGKRWREAPNQCSVCHRADDKHHGGIGNQCADCHNERKWSEVEYDHEKKARFALRGKHADTTCEACHPRARYQGTPKTCIGCHRKDDEHKGQYGEKCETCHGEKAWKPSTFNHDTDTKYALKGKHKGVKCASCHTAPLYRGKTSQDCVDCHRKDDKHKETLGTNCGSCHSERSWKEPPNFDHAKSRFPLLGRHAKVECKDCHKDALYRQTPSDCYACHRKDDKHDGTLGRACETCHGERDWKTTQGRFDHQKTKFPLRNAHAAPKVKCDACHADLRHLRDTRRDCFSCHQRDDRHEGTQGRDCERCHSDRDWKVPGFDHSRTRFALTGRHGATACKDCHKTLRFTDTGRDCWSCHQKDDTHKEKLGRACADCHNTRSWPLWDFDHDKRTKYPLEGKHRPLACERCHTAPAPAGAKVAETGTTCYACHRKADVHEGGYGRRCETCHGPDDWKRVRRPGAAKVVSKTDTGWRRTGGGPL